MVGGKIAHPETAWQTALREVQEETALTVHAMLAVPYINQFYEPLHDRINAIPVFVAIVRSGLEPTLDNEHTEYVWSTVEDALLKLPWPAQREGLQAAEELLSRPTSLHNHLKVPRTTP